MTYPIYPDFLATANKGYQTGQNMLATRLEGQAINGQGQDRQNALSQLAGVNPQASMALSSGFQDQQKAQEVDHAKKLNGAANFALAALQSKDPARIKGAGDAVGPYLTQLTGKPFTGLTPDMLPALYQIVSQSGGMATPHVNNIAAGATLTADDGTVLYSNPSAGPKPQLIQTADGSYVWATPGGGATPVTYGGGNAQGAPQAAAQPPADPMTPFIAQANDAIKMGAPEEQVKAWLMQKAASMGLQPIAPSDQSPEAQNQAMQAQPMGQQGMPPGAPVMGLQKSTAEDRETFGAPQMVIGTDGKQHLVQFGNRGGQKEVSGYAKPEMTPAQAAKQAVQQQKAESSKTDALDSYDQSITQIDKLLNSPSASMLGTFSGDIAGMIPHSDTSNANAALDNIKNQVLLNTISKLKSLSATGASGFGSLSNQEGEILKNSIASLDKKQSNAQLIENLRNIKNMLERSRNVIAGKQVEFNDSGVSGNGDSQGQPAAQSGGWSIQKVN